MTWICELIGIEPDRLTEFLDLFLREMNREWSRQIKLPHVPIGCLQASRDMVTDVTYQGYPSLFACCTYVCYDLLLMDVSRYLFLFVSLL